MPETLQAIPEELYKPKEKNTDAKEARRADFDRLLPLCQAGDQKAWDELAQLAEPIILNVTDQLGMKRQDAEDLKQKILGDLVAGKIARYHLGDFEAWLRVVAKNETLNFWRTERTQAKHYMRETVGKEGREAVQLEKFAGKNLSPEEMLAEAEIGSLQRKKLAEILKFIEEKNVAWVEIFRLHYIEGLSHIEVAKRLGIPKNTVHTSMARARIAIQKKYGIDLLEALGKTHLKRAA